ncbi:S1 family peptidase [Acaricomes phytoseiuli]|uniref:S1 family peptidase n=1 Tax=Acaricomes phytoseiuli TaxID=291968 RepID=UPI000362E78B|nr:S1 family peptidase [Acaricomes phytoseiuli]MCW1248601.1 S1 family peptidase [Acaricomes phytoseiuli]
MKSQSTLRKACLTGLATTSLLAGTLSLAALGASSATAAPQNDPVQAAVDYLVSEGISPAEAQHRIDTQAARGELAQKLESTLSTHIGGAYTDPASGELTVAASDDLGAAQAAAQGLKSVRVTNSLSSLQAASSALDTAFDAGTGARWAVDTVANKVELTLKNGTELNAAQQAAVNANASTVKITYTSTTASPAAGAAAYGGQRYLFDNDQYTCSIGFFAKSNNNPSDIKGVQAGHCTTDVGGRISKNGSDFGTNEDSTFGSGSSTDYGLLDINTNNFSGKGAVDKYDGTYLSVKGSTNVAVGDTICKSGQKTGFKCSRVTSTNASVTYNANNVTLRNMIRTNGCTIPGDSGGSNLSGNYAAGVTSGGNFTKSGNQYYCASNSGQADETYVQKIGPALQAYNVSLLTS